MSRKKRAAQQPSQNRYLREEDDAYRPFKGIKLGEGNGKSVSSSSVSAAPPRKNPPRPARKAGEPVVGGVDKDADFGDILAAFEAGEDVSKVRKGDDVKKRLQDDRPFGEILAEWEESQGIAPKRPPKKVTIKKSAPYKPTKDFGDLLDQFEGKPEKKPAAAPAPAAPRPRTVSQTLTKPSIPGTKSSVRTSGKSFGDILAQYEGKPVKKTGTPEQKGKEQAPAGGVLTHPSERKGEASAVKSSGKSFGEILDQFEGRTPASVKKHFEEKGKALAPAAQDGKKPGETPAASAAPAPPPAPGKEEKEQEAKSPAGKQAAVPAPEEKAETPPAPSSASEPEKDVDKVSAHPEEGNSSEEKEKAPGASSPAVAWPMPSGAEPIRAAAAIKVSGESRPENHWNPRSRRGEPAEGRPHSEFADLYRSWSQSHDEDGAIRKTEEEREEKPSEEQSIASLRAMLPLVTLDLHGYTVENARSIVKAFLEENWRKNLLKVAIITGKGIHSQDGTGVLREVIVSDLRLSPYVREFQSPKARYGGSGVLWVILKSRKS